MSFFKPKTEEEMWVRIPMTCNNKEAKDFIIISTIDFLEYTINIKLEEAIAFLKANVKNGWVNLDIKQSKGGSYYCELDTWEAKPQGNVQKEIAMPLPQDEGADLPF